MSKAASAIASGTGLPGSQSYKGASRSMCSGTMSFPAKRGSSRNARSFSRPSESNTEPRSWTFAAARISRCSCMKRLGPNWAANSPLANSGLASKSRARSSSLVSAERPPEVSATVVGVSSQAR